MDSSSFVLQHRRPATGAAAREEQEPQRSHRRRRSPSSLHRPHHRLHTQAFTLPTRWIVLATGCFLVLVLVFAIIIRTTVYHPQTAATTTTTSYSIPVVYLVHDRVDYFRQSILDSLLQSSDFLVQQNPRPTIIISHDGTDSVRAMKDVLMTVRRHYPNIVLQELIHPFANLCRRKDTTTTSSSSASVSCAKHHFTWMLRTVVDKFGGARSSGDDHGPSYDAFLFLEEDYLVAPTIYQTLQSGMSILQQQQQQQQQQQENHNNQHQSLFLGLTLDPTAVLSPLVQRRLPHAWVRGEFISGPMVISTHMLHQLVSSGSASSSVMHAYCTYNDYNWDWSLVHALSADNNNQKLPSAVLMPSIPQVQHIGSTGMHYGVGSTRNAAVLRGRPGRTLLQSFHGTELYAQQVQGQQQREAMTAFGGWDDSRDVQHCLELLHVGR